MLEMFDEDHQEELAGLHRLLPQYHQFDGLQESIFLILLMLARNHVRFHLNVVDDTKEAQEMMK